MIVLGVFIVLAVLVITNRIAGRTYVTKVLLAFDYFVCVLWTRNIGLSISGQAGLYWRRGRPPVFWYALHEGLNVIQKDHCELALVHDRERADAVVKLLS
jgi:hypothetical protein